MMRSAREDVNACASVLATMKSPPDRPDTIMLLTALPPAPPTPQTMMRGFNSLSSGAFRLIDMLASLVGRPPAPIGMRVFPSPTPSPSASASYAPSKTVLEPPPHPLRVADVTLLVGAVRASGRKIFEPRHLRIDHEPDRRGESRALAGFRQPFDPERPPDAGLARQRRAGQFRQPG